MSEIVEINIEANKFKEPDSSAPRISDKMSSPLKHAENGCDVKPRQIKRVVLKKM